MLHIPIHSSARAKALTILYTGFSNNSRFPSPTSMAKRFAWLCFLCMSYAAMPLPAQTVVINEIMYHPPSTNLLEEWFEIYNPGTNAVDLSGWQVTKGVEFTFPSNSVIAVGGYLVVAADRATFTNR